MNAALATLADIRARHFGGPMPPVLLHSPAGQPAAAAADEWIAAGADASISRTRRIDGGYELRVRGNRVAVVQPVTEGAHQGWVVVNVPAGNVRSPVIGDVLAGRLAMRIARLVGA